MKPLRPVRTGRGNETFERPAGASKAVRAGSSIRLNRVGAGSAGSRSLRINCGSYEWPVICDVGARATWPKISGRAAGFAACLEDAVFDTEHARCRERAFARAGSEVARRP